MNSEEQGRFVNGKWIPEKQDPDIQVVKEIRSQGCCIFIPVH
jgi:hypothetical protein